MVAQLLVVWYELQSFSVQPTEQLMIYIPRFLSKEEVFSFSLRVAGGGGAAKGRRACILGDDVGGCVDDTVTKSLAFAP